MSNLTFRPGQRASRRLTPKFQMILAGCVVVSMGYAIYGNITQTGLVGYIMKAEMDLFGSADEGMTFMVSFVSVGLALALLMGVAEKVAPSLVYLSPESSSQLQPGILERANRPVGSVSWKAVGLTAVLPILIGGVVAGVLYGIDRRDEKQTVHQIDLGTGITDPPKGAKFVEVTGLMARSYVISYKKSENSSVSHEIFAPIIGKGWTPGEPVHYFVRHQASESYDGKVDWPEPFKHNAVGVFSGTIGQALPTFAEKSFRSKGLKLSPSYSVITWEVLPDHKVPAPTGENSLLALGVGGLVSIFLFPMMIVVKFKQARMQGKAARA